MKIIGKIKTCAAAFVLGTIVIASTSMAADTFMFEGITCTGYKTLSNYGYRSFTKASHYDDKGFPFTVGAKSSMGSTTSKIVYGSGVASVYSGYAANKDAQHWVCHGKDITKNYYFWINN